MTTFAFVVVRAAQVCAARYTGTHYAGLAQAAGSLFWGQLAAVYTAPQAEAGNDTITINFEFAVSCDAD